jgi:NAD-dependent deacetylase
MISENALVHWRITMPPTTLDRAAALLRGARSLLVLTGAGISAESGIRTYRGPGGVYEEDPSLPGTVSAAGLSERPDDVWRYVDGIRQQVAATGPNAAHGVLAEWESELRFERFLIATQNVDGLHQAAGSDRVSELHGSIWRFSAPRPEEPEPEELAAFFDEDDHEETLRKWSIENEGVVWENREVPFPSIPPSTEPGVRPDVVLFGEQYGNRLLWVEYFIRQGVDAVLVVGCSGGVSVLFHLLDRVRAENPAAAIVNVNPHEDCIPGEHQYVAAPATEGLAALDALLMA